MRGEVLAFEMNRWPVSRDLSLLRQGLSIGSVYGPHSLLMLARVAEIVEASVYEPKSLGRIPSGVRFVLRNPPLRIGTFSSIRAYVNGTEIAPDRARLRVEPTVGLRTFQSVDRGNPIALIPGRRVTIELDVAGPLPPRGLTILLKFHCMAIPPQIWFEFTDAIQEPEGGS